MDLISLPFGERFKKIRDLDGSTIDAALADLESQEPNRDVIVLRLHLLSAKKDVPAALEVLHSTPAHGDYRQVLNRCLLPIMPRDEILTLLIAPETVTAYKNTILFYLRRFHKKVHMDLDFVLAVKASLGSVQALRLLGYVSPSVSEDAIFRTLVETFVIRSFHSLDKGLQTRYLRKYPSVVLRLLETELTTSDSFQSVSSKVDFFRIYGSSFKSLIKNGSKDFVVSVLHTFCGSESTLDFLPEIISMHQLTFVRKCPDELMQVYYGHVKDNSLTYSRVYSWRREDVSVCGVGFGRKVTRILRVEKVARLFKLLIEGTSGGEGVADTAASILSSYDKHLDGARFAAFWNEVFSECADDLAAKVEMVAEWDLAYTERLPIDVAFELSKRRLVRKEEIKPVDQEERHLWLRYMDIRETRAEFQKASSHREAHVRASYLRAILCATYDVSLVAPEELPKTMEWLIPRLETEDCEVAVCVLSACVSSPGLRIFAKPENLPFLAKIVDAVLNCRDRTPSVLQNVSNLLTHLLKPLSHLRGGEVAQKRHILDFVLHYAVLLMKKHHHFTSLVNPSSTLDVHEAVLHPLVPEISAAVDLYRLQAATTHTSSSKHTHRSSAISQILTKFFEGDERFYLQMGTEHAGVMSSLIQTYLQKQPKSERVRRVKLLLELDPSVMTKPDIQEIVFHDCPDSLGPYLAMNRQLVYDDFVAMTRREDVGFTPVLLFAARGLKFCFRVNLVRLYGNSLVSGQREALFKMMQSFVLDEDNHANTALLQLYCNTLSDLRVSEALRAEYNVLLEKLEQLNDKSISIMAKVTKLVASDWNVTAGRLCKILDNENCLVAGAFLNRALGFVPHQRLVGLFSGVLADEEVGVSAKKAVLRLLAAMRSPEIVVKGIYYPLWKREKVHKDLRVTVLRECVREYLLLDEVWEMLEDAVVSEYDQLVMVAFQSVKVLSSRYPSDVFQGRIQTLQLKALTHEDLNIRVKAYQRVEEGHFDADVFAKFTEIAANEICDFSVPSDHDLACTAFKKLKQLVDKDPEGRKGALVGIMDRLIEMNELDYDKTRWDIPLYARLNRFASNLAEKGSEESKPAIVPVLERLMRLDSARLWSSCFKTLLHLINFQVEESIMTGIREMREFADAHFPAIREPLHLTRFARKLKSHLQGWRVSATESVCFACAEQLFKSEDPFDVTCAYILFVTSAGALEWKRESREILFEARKSSCSVVASLANRVVIPMDCFEQDVSEAPPPVRGGFRGGFRGRGRGRGRRRRR